MTNVDSVMPLSCHMDFDAVILADGDFPKHPTPISLLKNAKMLVCCDAAGEHLVLNHGIMPTAIVGDCDSMNKDFHCQHADIIYKVDEQDYNDLTKATRLCLSKGCRRIAYLGCTGKREDHTIGNVFLLNFYKRELGIYPVMITDYGYFIVAGPGTTQFASFARQQVSIFNISCTELNGNGLRWQPYPFKELWQGSLNEACDNTFEINANGEYIVYMTHEAKE